MTEITQHYLDQFNAASAGLAGRGLPWLDDQRQAAIELFARSGFPGQYEEDWRYTPLKPVIGKMLHVKVDSDIADTDISKYLVTGLDAYRLVFVDGRLSPQYSDTSELQDCIVVNSFEQSIVRNPELFTEAMRSEVPLSHGFAALNVAFSTDGYVIEVAENVKLDKPVEIIFIAVDSDLATQPRNIVHMGKFSQAVIIERYVSSKQTGAVVNSTSRISLDEGAKLGYYLVQTQANDASQISSVDVNQGRSSWFGCYTLTLGGQLVRNNLRVSLQAEGAHCDMLGLYNTGGKQHVDNHTTVVHAAPHCTSRELYKGVLDQRSRAVFHGRIKVEQGAQKTDASQSNNNLLLSSNAEVDTKPQLEIYADDVKCAHGATIGQIDQNSLFYLRSRGIDEEDARALLTFAFLNEVLDEIELEPLKQLMESILAERLIDDE